MKKNYERGCGVDALVQCETLFRLCLFRVSTVDAEFRLRSEILRDIQGLMVVFIMVLEKVELNMGIYNYV